jgi:hypothetical protein
MIPHFGFVVTAGAALSVFKAVFFVQPLPYFSPLAGYVNEFLIHNYREFLYIKALELLKKPYAA